MQANLQSPGREIVFREARSTAELERMLRLRYEAFETSRAAEFEPRNAVGFNLDAWDPYSRHLGLFLRDGSAERLVAYHRFIEDRVPRDARIIELARRYPSAADISPRPAPFPLLNYWPERDAVSRAYRHLRDEGARVVEGSRLSLHRDFRGLRFVQSLLQAETTLMFDEQIDAIWTACRSAHRRFYEKIGFRRISCTSDCGVAHAGNLKACSLVIRAEWFPGSWLDSLAGEVATRTHVDGTKERLLNGNFAASPRTTKSGGNRVA